MSKGLKIGLIAGVVVLLGGAAAWFFLRMRERTEHLQLIPENAALVAVINVRSLFEKSQPDDLRKLKSVEKQKKTPAFGEEKVLRDLLRNPMNAGVDIVQNIYGFMAENGSRPIGGVVLKVNDEDAFKQTVEKLSIGETPKRKVGFWFVRIDWHTALAWNKEAAIFFTMGDGDLDQTAERFLFRKEAESILSNSDFQEFRNHSCDLGVFTNNAALLTLVPQMGNDAQAMQQSFGADGYSELLLNFEDNRIALDFEGHPKTPQPVMMREAGLNATHFETLSDKEPLLYLGMALDVANMLATIDKNPEAKESIDAMEQQAGISRNDIKQMFTGDLSLAFSDYKNLYETDPHIKADLDQMAEIYEGFNDRFEQEGSGEDYSFKREMNLPILICNIGVKDEAKVKSLLEKIGLKQDGSAWVAPGRGNYVYTALKNNHLVISNSYALAQTVGQSGKLGGKVPAPVADLAKSKPLVMYADLNMSRYPKLFLDETKNELGEQGFGQFMDFMKVFQNVSMEGAGTKSTLNINLAPCEGNSLFRLIKQADDVFVN